MCSHTHAQHPTHIHTCATHIHTHQTFNILTTHSHTQHTFAHTQHTFDTVIHKTSNTHNSHSHTQLYTHSHSICDTLPHHSSHCHTTDTLTCPHTLTPTVTLPSHSFIYSLSKAIPGLESRKCQTIAAVPGAPSEQGLGEVAELRPLAWGCPLTPLPTWWLEEITTLAALGCWTPKRGVGRAGCAPPCVLPLHLL